MMKQMIQEIIRGVGDTSFVEAIRSVSGGDINDAFFVETGKQCYFVKINPDAVGNFFSYEADGLRILQATETLPVPDVYFEGEKDGTPILVLEWVKDKHTQSTEEELGHGLAYMHQTYGQAFGLDYDNYIGTMRQPNSWHREWLSFYGDNRLDWQAQVARQKGHWDQKREKRMEKLLLRLEDWLPKYPKPATLHGDLWGGNWIVGTGGVPYLIDPAVFYGHHEYDLAFTELFGGYSSRFYDAYREVQSIPAEYEERRPLYQLFYLLVHLNSFGENFGAPVDRILKTYGT